MNLSNKRSRYTSQAPQTAAAGGEHLLAYLRWDSQRNASHFSSGNLLVHGLCTKDTNHHNLDWESYSFKHRMPSTPGLHHTSIFPTTASVETNDRLTDEAADLAFLRNGKEVKLTWLRDGRTWTPWCVEDSFEGEGIRLDQRIAILSLGCADVLGCRIEISGDLAGLEVELVGRVFRESEIDRDGPCLWGRITAESPDFRFVTRPGYDGPWGSGPANLNKAVGTCYGLFTNVGQDDARSRAVPGPSGATYCVRGPAKRAIWVLFAAGFEAEEVRSAMERARADLDGFFDAAARRWRDFFHRDVPALSCSDPAVERAYAEALAACFLSIYDVAYDPFRYPFSAVSGKTNANWHMQFWHDSLFASRTFLWLNDAQRCKHDLLQMIDVQYVHCNPAFGQPYPDPVALIPTSLNFLATIGWEIYCRTRDTDFLRTVLYRFLDFDRRKCRPLPAGTVLPPDVEQPKYSFSFAHRHYDTDGDWLINSQLSGDDTCRADPFTKGARPKHWYELPETPLEPADSNLYLLGNRMAMRRMAEVMGDREVMQELDSLIAHHRAAMERWMWNEAKGRFTDIEERAHAPSPVHEVGNITPALANGLVDQPRAERLIRDLLDPELFWTPLPCPSCPVNHPGVNGKPGFRPTGYWRGRAWPLFLVEAIQGLHRYGRTEHAAYLVHLVLRTLAAASTPAPENFNPLDRSVPGMPMMSFGSQLLHPLLSFTTGLQMGPGDDLEFDPIALDPAWQHFRFGPFHYRPGVIIEVSWAPDAGYVVRVNGESWRFPVPTRFTLRRQAHGYALDRSSVLPLRFAGHPPITIVCAKGAGPTVVVSVYNQTGTPAAGRMASSLLVPDHGLCRLPEWTFSLEAHETRKHEITLPATAKAQDWFLAAMTLQGYPVTVSEGILVG